MVTISRNCKHDLRDHNNVMYVLFIYLPELEVVLEPVLVLVSVL